MHFLRGHGGHFHRPLERRYIRTFRGLAPPGPPPPPIVPPGWWPAAVDVPAMEKTLDVTSAVSPAGSLPARATFQGRHRRQRYRTPNATKYDRSRARRGAFDRAITSRTGCTVPRHRQFTVTCPTDGGQFLLLFFVPTPCGKFALQTFCCVMEFRFGIGDVATEEVMKIDKTLTAAGHEQNDAWATLSDFWRTRFRGARTGREQFDSAASHQYEPAGRRGGGLTGWRPGFGGAPGEILKNLKKQHTVTKLGGLTH